MKSTFLKKFLCILSAAVLVFSFAACGNNEDEGNTTEPSVVEENTLDTAAGGDVSASDTQADSTESDSAKDTQAQSSEKTEETKDQSQGGGSTVSKPDSKADIISAYNSAVTKSGLSRTAMTQTLTKGLIKAPIINYDVMSGEHANVRNQINVNNTSKTASDLKALSSSNVKTATRSGNTVTITLNNFSGSSVSNGAGGYVGVVDDARRNQIVDIIASDIGVNGIKVASGTYTLQNGVIKATFNDDFTKITKVTFSASESFDGKIKYGITIDANVAVNLSSTYSA